MASRQIPRPLAGAPPSASVENPVAWKHWLFAGSRANLEQKLNYFKYHAPYPAQRLLTSHADDPRFSLISRGNLFPKQYCELQADAPLLPLAKDWLAELLWNSLLFAEHSNVLADFVKFRSKFGTSFILGKYEQASAILGEIKAKFGVSLWTLEKEFLLFQYQSGFTENKSFLSDIQKGDCSVYITYLASLFSIRVEQDTSPDYYLKALSTKVYADYPDPQNRVREYICTYADPCSADEIANKSFCLWRDEAGSLIDRYIQSLKVIRRAISTDISRKEISRLRPIAEDLSRRVSDPALSAITRTLSDSEEALPQSVATEEFNKSLDQYLAGKFTQCVETLTDQLRQFPLIFDFYELLARAIAYSNIDSVRITESSSFANTLVELLSQAISEKVGYKKAESALRTLCQHLGENNLAFGINLFLQRRDNAYPEKNLLDLGKLYDRIENPLHFHELQEDIARNSFEQYIAKFPNSLSAEFLFTAYSRHLKDSRDLRIADFFWETTYAEELIELGNPQEALVVIEDLQRRRTEIPDCLKAEIIALKFDVYRELRMPRLALKLFIDAYFLRPHLVSHIPIGDFLSENDFAREKLDSSAELLVARGLAAKGIQEIYEALDDFLFANRCAKPRDILSIASKFDDRVFRFIVTDVMRRDVLSRGSYCENSKRLDEERLFLLNALGTKTSGKQTSDVANEISSLNRELFIREANRHVNAGRVSINVGYIKDSAEVIRHTFERYKSLKEAERTANVKLVPLASLVLDDDADEKQSKPTQEPVAESLAVFGELMFTVCLDWCLFSDIAGLDAILSARIRHGALSNMIRSPFEEASIITRKHVSKEFYLPPQKWDLILRESEESDDSIKVFDDAVRLFSSSVDAIVSNLQGKILQIQITKIPQLDLLLPQYTSNPAGMFDYTQLLFRGRELEKCIGETSVSADELIDRLIEVFVEYTNGLLENVRSYIRENAGKELREAVEKLLVDVKGAGISARIYYKFQDEVSKAKIALQNMIDGLCEWFQFKGQQPFLDGPIEVVFDTVLKALNESSGGRLEKADITIPDLVLKGECFHAFYDIVFTLLYNVIEHSDLPGDSVGLRIVCAENGGVFRLEVSNNVNDAKSAAQCAEIANDWITRSAAGEIGRIAKEGRSGFVKIRKILARDLGRNSVLINASELESNRFSIVLEFESEGFVYNERSHN